MKKHQQNLKATSVKLKWEKIDDAILDITKSQFLDTFKHFSFSKRPALFHVIFVKTPCDTMLDSILRNLIRVKLRNFLYKLREFYSDISTVFDYHRSEYRRFARFLAIQGSDFNSQQKD